MDIVPTNPDGLCLYHALSLKLPGEKAKSLVTQVAKYLVEHQNDLWNGVQLSAIILAPNETYNGNTTEIATFAYPSSPPPTSPPPPSTPPPPRSRISQEMGIFTGEDYAKHITGERLPQIWGSSFEMHVVRKIKKRVIHLFLHHGRFRDVEIVRLKYRVPGEQPQVFIGGDVAKCSCFGRTPE